MRALGPGSVSSFLKIILDVAFYVLWVVIGCLIVASLVTVLFSFNPALLGEKLVVGLAKAHITAPMMVGAVLGLTLYLGGILVIVNRLRRVFQTLTAGDPFHPDNVRRLRVIGLILAGLELGRYVFWGVMAVLAPNIDKADGGLNLTTWFSVLVIFVLAEVFREGARLRREAELTI